MKCFSLLLASQCLAFAPLSTNNLRSAATTSQLFVETSRPSFINTTTSDLTQLYAPPKVVTTTTESSKIFSAVSEVTTTAPTTEALGAAHVSSAPAATKETTTKESAADDTTESRQRDSIKFSQMLALNSGVVNGIFLSGILGRIQAVTPVTDSWTKGAIATTCGDMHKAAFLAAVLLSFSMGSLLTGLLNPKPELWNLQQRTKPLLLASSLMATAAALVAMAVTTTGNAVPSLAFFLVCMASGVQNSFSSTLTQNWCRTTHMTGTTTDLCTILGQTLAGNTASKFKIQIYGGLITMFTLGGLLGGAWGVKSAGKAAVCLGASSGLYLVAAVPSLGTKLVSTLKRRRDY